jgi:hypothetical protein
MPGKPPAVGEFRLPAPTGSVFLSSGERQAMRAVGLGPNDDVPPDLIQRVQAARAEQQAEEQAELERIAASGAVLNMPETVDISARSASKQRELLQAVQENAVPIDWPGLRKKEQARLRELEPHVRQTIQQSMRMAEQAEAARPQPAYDGEADEVPTAVPPESPSAPPTTESPGTKPEDKKEASPEVSLAEKMDFIASIVGGRPFRKGYRLFGNKLVFSFRQLSKKADTLALQQAKLLAKTDETLFIPSYMDFRMILGLDYVISTEARLEVAQEVDQHLASCTAAELRASPVLDDIRSELQDNDLLRSETVWMSLFTYWNQFLELVTYLESKRADENFWRGIGD